MKVLWTKEAVVQLRKIGKYISFDNPIVAENFISKLVELGNNLDANSYRGRIVPEFSIPEIRELLYKNYRIVYIVKKSRIEILTVFESHQLIKKEQII